MKILIAGLGSIGRRHLRNLLALQDELDEPVEIALFRRRSSPPDDGLAGFPTETHLTFALAWGPEAVIISNPTALHLEVAIPAAEAGCHLLLEKPVSHNLDGLDALRASMQRTGCRVHVGYQFRFHPGLQKARRLLQEGAIGRPLSVRAHWGEWLPGWHPGEDYRAGYSARQDLGGGVVLTLSHPLDYLRWLFGEISSVWAFAGKLSDLELWVEDNAEIGLRFANGMLGSLHLDYTQRPPSHHLEVIGTQGTLRWDNADGAVKLYSIPPESGGEGVKPPAWQTFRPPSGFDRDSLFQDQLRHFLALARGRAGPVCTLEDGARALELALAAQRSQREGALVDMASFQAAPPPGAPPA